MSGIFSSSMKSLLILLALFLGLAYCKHGIIIDKVFDHSAVVVGKPFEVTFDIYNRGNSDVHKVMFLDTSFPVENFTLVSGAEQLTLDIPVIKAGDSHSVSFKVKSLIRGVINDSPALVSYNDAKDGFSKRAFSTSLRGIYIMSEEEYHIYVASSPIKWAFVLTLSLLMIVAPAIAYRNSSVLNKKEAPKTKVR